MNRKVVLVSAARTPFDKFGGVMRDMSTVELGARAYGEAIKRAGIKPEEVQEVYVGINMPSSNRSIARQIALKAGMPEETNALTVDRACCSSLAAFAMGYRAVAMGEADITIGGGAENMSKVPYFLDDLRWGKRIGDITLQDIMVVKCPYTGEPRAVQAGAVAVEYGISREEQDAWAVRSHKRALQAYAEGKFAYEILPMEVISGKKTIVLDKDQSLREDVTLESLGKLKTVYHSPTVTAGNAPGLNTGASAVVIMADAIARQKGIKPLAEIISHAQVSAHPRGIAYTPAYAALKALKKAGLTIEQMKVVEINEAFAAMPLVSSKILGENDPAKIEALRAKMNVNGGAIAIGHPTGASAVRLLMTLCFELRRRGGGYGLISICGGIGEGESVVVRVEG